MRPKFSIRFCKSSGNLYVQPAGVLDGSSACEMVNLPTDPYDGSGRVYIETRMLCDICPFGESTLQCRLSMSGLPLRQCIFKGPAGFQIAPEACQVIGSAKAQKPIRDRFGCTTGGEEKRKKRVDKKFLPF